MGGYQPNFELIVAIEIAFNGISRGEGITIHEADELDNHGNAQEREVARTLDGEARWQDVPDEAIERHISAWQFLDPGGFLYYLPAGMRWCLKVGRSSEAATADVILNILAEAKCHQWCTERLDAVQLGVISNFVEEMFRFYWIAPDARKNNAELIKFWSRFRTPSTRCKGKQEAFP